MEELATNMARAPHFSDMKPFLFERSFDDPNAPSPAEEEEARAAAKEERGAEDVPEPIMEVTYGEAEFEAAKQAAYMDGHADGFREGQAEAMETINHKLNELLERMSPMIAALGENQARSNERAQANMARIVKATLSKLMPVYVRHHGHEEVLAVVSECLAELQDPGRLTVRLSEESADLLGDRLSKAAQRAGFEGTVRLLTDPEMDRSDVRVDWGAGGAERRYETIQNEIETAIDGAVARAEAALEPEAEDAPQDLAGEDAPPEAPTETMLPEAGIDQPEPDAIADLAADPTRE